jgi:hypothetical protein
MVSPLSPVHPHGGAFRSTALRPDSTCQSTRSSRSGILRQSRNHEIRF